MAVFSAYYLPHLGGVELFTHNLCGQLAKMGHRVVIVTSSAKGCPSRETLPNGVEVFRLPTKHLANDRFPMPCKGKDASSIERRLNGIPFDSVVVNTRIYPLSLLGVKFAARRNIVPIVIEHGSGHLTVGNAIIDKAMQRYEHVLVNRIGRYHPRYYGVSQAAASWLSHFGIRASGVIHNSIDADAFVESSSTRDFRRESGIERDTPVVTFTGRLIPEKGIWTICESARILESEGVNVRFFFAGDGPDMNRLREEAPGNVTLLGKLSREDIASLLMQSDVFCFPSEYPEGLPTSLLEAAACNNFIVCTDAGGTREVVESDAYGTVLERPYVESLTEAIRGFTRKPDDYRDIRNRAEERIRRLFSWEQAAQDTMRAIQDARDQRSSSESASRS